MDDVMMRWFTTRLTLARRMDDQQAEIDRLRSRCEHLDEIINHQREAMQAMGAAYRQMWAESTAVAEQLTTRKVQ